MSTYAEFSSAAAPDPATIGQRVATYSNRNITHPYHDEPVFAVDVERNTRAIVQWGRNCFMFGHYSAEQGDWQLYPEYVRVEEEESLRDVCRQLGSQAFARLRNGVIPETSSPIIDVEAPMTADARWYTSQLLRTSNVATGILECKRLQGNSWFMDGATDCYLTAWQPPQGAPALNRPQPSGLQVGAVFEGLIIEDPSREQKWRKRMRVPLAERRPDLGDDVWVPHDVITDPNEWAAVWEGMIRLGEYEQTERAFSRQDCGMLLRGSAVLN